VHHFQQTIEILALTEDDDPASRDEYTQELHGWISEVEKMREEAEVLEIHHSMKQNLKTSQACSLSLSHQSSNNWQVCHWG
jgi:hypothetical protein